MDILNKGRKLMGSKMNDKMVQHSVFAGIVFIIIAHPQTFKIVDSVLKVHDKNLLLLVHAIVVALIMYFGGLYIFDPIQKAVLEGMGKNLNHVSLREAINCVNGQNSNEMKDSPSPSSPSPIEKIPPDGIGDPLIEKKPVDKKTADKKPPKTWYDQ